MVDYLVKSLLKYTENHLIYPIKEAIADVCIKTKAGLESFNIDEKTMRIETIFKTNNPQELYRNFSGHFILIKTEIREYL